MGKTLILPLKKKWFDLIKAGIKTEEYRAANEYWATRLVGKNASVSRPTSIKGRLDIGSNPVEALNILRPCG